MIDNGTKKYLDQRFDSLEKVVEKGQDRFESVLKGETPCKPAVQIAKLDGKVKMLRLLWLPIIMALLLLALKRL